MGMLPSCSISHAIFKTVLIFLISTIFSVEGTFWSTLNHRVPPLGIKKEKLSDWILIHPKKRPDALKSTQKTSVLCKVSYLKKEKKTSNNYQFWPKLPRRVIFEGFSDDSREFPREILTDNLYGLSTVCTIVTYGPGVRQFKETESTKIFSWWANSQRQAQGIERLERCCKSGASLHVSWFWPKMSRLNTPPVWLLNTLPTHSFSSSLLPTTYTPPGPAGQSISLLPTPFNLSSCRSICCSACREVTLPSPPTPTILLKIGDHPQHAGRFTHYGEQSRYNHFVKLLIVVNLALFLFERLITGGLLADFQTFNNHGRFIGRSAYLILERQICLPFG